MNLMWKRHLPKASAVFERQALFGVDIEVETFGFAIARAGHFWQHANICNVQTLPISHAKTNPGIRRKCFCIVVPCQTGLHCLRSLQIGGPSCFSHSLTNRQNGNDCKCRPTCCSTIWWQSSCTTPCPLALHKLLPTVPCWKGRPTVRQRHRPTGFAGQRRKRQRKALAMLGAVGSHVGADRVPGNPPCC